MKRWLTIVASLAGHLAGCGGACAAVVIAIGAYVYALGPAPLGRHLEYSHLVLDRNGHLLRAYATPEGRWRLPATVEGCRSAFLQAAVRLRG